MRHRSLFTLRIVTGLALATALASSAPAQDSEKATRTAVRQDPAKIAPRLTAEIRQQYGEEGVKRLLAARNRNELIEVLKSFRRSSVARTLAQGVQYTSDTSGAAAWGIDRIDQRRSPQAIPPEWLGCLNCLGVHCPTALSDEAAVSSGSTFQDVSFAMHFERSHPVFALLQRRDHVSALKEARRLGIAIEKGVAKYECHDGSCACAGVSDCLRMVHEDEKCKDGTVDCKKSGCACVERQTPSEHATDSR